MSTIKTSTFVLQICLKNSRPNPLFIWAPSIIPGISAIVILNSSTNLIFPTEGFNVVNQQFAILGNARDTDAKKVDFPIFGNPTKPISANVFNSKNISFFCPNFPCLSSQVKKGKFWFPFPFQPPFAITYLLVLSSKSTKKFFFQVFYIVFSSQFTYIQYTKVPQGTLKVVFPPFLPSFPRGPPQPPSFPSITLLRK